MPKSRKKAIRSLAQEKVVDISDFRSLQGTKEDPKLAIVGAPADWSKSLGEILTKSMDVSQFDTRFNFEKALKAQSWSLLILDERSLGEDALALCEKIKRGEKREDVPIIVLSDKLDKDIVREGFEKGCDEWVTKTDDLKHLASLVSYYAGH